MKLKRKKKTEFWWLQFSRVQKAQQNYDQNSVEWIKLNKVGWTILEKYIKALLDDFF